MNVDSMRKMFCFSVKTSNLKSEKFSSGERVQTHIPCCVLSLQFPAYSLLLSNKAHEMPSGTGLLLETEWEVSFIGNEGGGWWRTRKTLEPGWWRT